LLLSFPANDEIPTEKPVFMFVFTIGNISRHIEGEGLLYFARSPSGMEKAILLDRSVASIPDGIKTSIIPIIENKSFVLVLYNVAFLSFLFWFFFWWS